MFVVYYILAAYLAVQYIEGLSKVTFKFYKVARCVNFIELELRY
jgi:hypothetical protein